MHMEMRAYLAPLAERLAVTDPSLTEGERLDRAHALVLKTNVEPRQAIQVLDLLLPGKNALVLRTEDMARVPETVLDALSRALD